MTSKARAGVYTHECTGEFELINFAAVCAAVKTVATRKKNFWQVCSPPVMAAGKYHFGITVAWIADDEGNLERDAKLGVMVERLDDTEESTHVWLKRFVVVNRQASRNKKMADDQYFRIGPGADRGWAPSPAGARTSGGPTLREIFDASQGWLHEGALKVACEMSVLVDVVFPLSTFASSSCQQEVCDSLGELLASKHLADKVLTVGDTRLEVHAAILAARSPVFAKMFASDMREGREKEVPLADLEAGAVRALVTFLYTGKAPREAMDSEERSIALLQAAHRFEVPSLIDMCARALAGRLSIETVSETLKVADTFGCAGLRVQCLSYMREHMAEVQSAESFALLVRQQPALIMDVISSLAPASKRRRTGDGSEST